MKIGLSSLIARAKYDRYLSMQDYRGFRTKGRKEWLDDFGFGVIPDEVFIQYDEMRQSLADEVIISIEDTMAETQLSFLQRRLKTVDYEFMRMIDREGPIYHEKIYQNFGEELGKEIVTRLKSRGVISPTRSHDSGYYRYDLNEIGHELLGAHKQTSQEPLGSKISKNST